MDPAQAFAVILFSFIAGLFGSLLGLGGGFIIVPALTLVLGIDIKIAISASLIGIIANSSISSPFYLKEGLTNVRLGLLLGIGTCIGGVMGALIAVYLLREVIALLFAVVLLLLALLMRLNPTGGGSSEECESSGREDPEPGIPGEWTDRVTGKTTRYRASNLGKGLGASFAAGNLSGILGIGGGVINVPAMCLWMGVPLKAATATSLFMIGMTSVAGALVYYSFGLVSSVVAVLVIFGIFAGSGLGSRLSPRVRSESLRTVFVGVMIIISVLMFMKAFGLYPG